MKSFEKFSDSGDEEMSQNSGHSNQSGGKPKFLLNKLDKKYT